MPEGQRVVGVDRQYGRAMSSQWLAILKEEIVLLRVSLCVSKRLTPPAAGEFKERKCSYAHELIDYVDLTCF